MNSATFTNDWNVVDAGGATRNSATYKMYDGLFQTGIDVSQSAIFGMGQAGFVQVFDTPTPTATPSSTPTPTFTSTGTPTFSSTVTPTFTPTITPTSTVTLSPAGTGTDTSTITPTFSDTETSTSTATPSQTSTATVTPTDSSTSTATPSQTSTSTVTPSRTSTSTVTPSQTSTSTSTVTPSQTSTSTVTPSQTATSTVTPSQTSTSTSTVTPTSTSTATPTSSSTTSLTFSDTPTSSSTSTSTRTVSPSSTETGSFTDTPTSTSTATQTPTRTVSPSSTSTVTPPDSFTSTDTPTSSVTPSSTSTVTLASTGTFSSTITPTFSATMTPTSTRTASPTSTVTPPLTPTDTPTRTSTSTQTLTQTPQAPVLAGPIQACASCLYVFTGSGQPGLTVFIQRQPGNSTLGSAVVAANGTFSVSTASITLNVGDSIEAHAGSAGGPMGSPQTVVTGPGGTPPANSNTPDVGATVLTVSGVAGQTVVIVNSGTGQVLGQGTIGGNGQGAVTLNPPTTAGAVLDVIVQGVITDTVTVSASPGQPASLDPGFVFIEGNVLTGTGVPGAQVQLVDNNGLVLGSTIAAPNGTFSLPVSGAQAGTGLKLLQNGVAVNLPLTPQKLGENRVFISKNVFKPLQGGTLDIGFKAIADEHVTVKIFNLAGELVRPVVDMDAKTGVVYALSWDGKNLDGQTVASGVYFVSAKGGQTHILKKVIVLK